MLKKHSVPKETQGTIGRRETCEEFYREKKLCCWVSFIFTPKYFFLLKHKNELFWHWGVWKVFPVDVMSRTISTVLPVSEILQAVPCWAPYKSYRCPTWAQLTQRQLLTVKEGCGCKDWIYWYVLTPNVGHIEVRQHRVAYCLKGFLEAWRTKMVWSERQTKES